MPVSGLSSLRRLGWSEVQLCVMAGLALAFAGAGAARALRPDSAPFQISLCSGCPARHPFVALEGGGGAVVWESGILAGLSGRRLDVAGNPSGLPVNLSFRQATAGPVDVAPDGVAWAAFATVEAPTNEVAFSEIADNRGSFVLRGDAETPRLEPGGLVALGGTAVFASFEDLAADGTARQWVWRLGLPPSGAARQVAETEGLARPRVCPRPDGTFVVAWRTRSVGSFGVSYSLRSADGDVVRPPTALVENLDSDPQHALACARDGRFAIVWQSSAHPGAVGSDVLIQRFDRKARKVRQREIANASLPGDQGAPAIAFDPNGSLLVAFQSVVADQQQVRARRFAANGAAEGAEARVDTGAAVLGDVGPAHPGIAPVGTAGRALVVWSEGERILGRKLRR
jgi:hypothetical protein